MSVVTRWDSEFYCRCPEFDARIPFFEPKMESVDLWSPSNSLFKAPEVLTAPGVSGEKRNVEYYSEAITISL